MVLGSEGVFFMGIDGSMASGVANIAKFEGAGTTVDPINCLSVFFNLVSTS